ncbi:Allatostatin [Pseudolycoriella hygida]|uniref:Allatostatin n=1 Tax=Pseudolycoriella hygida TaxID=35572 RepID=A0A9Q0NB01_9DIPT|nr:Allatostatin [Pseudolycoriella hygida]
MSSSMQIAYQLLVLSVIMTMAVSRPQNGIENQESAENQPSVSDLQNLQKFYTSYRLAGPGGYMGVEESSPIDRVPLQYFRSPSVGGNNMANYWDPMFRLPEMKRQVRYRQCYFNPISCFKK